MSASKGSLVKRLRYRWLDRIVQTLPERGNP